MIKSKTIMKKLLLLALVMCGGVMQASAGDVTRRIVAELQDNSAGAGLVSTWTGWKDGPHIHVYYNDGTDHNLTGTWWSTSMTYIGSYSQDDKLRKLYYTDVTADETVFSNYDLHIIIAGEEAEDDYKRITYSGRYSKDQIFYIYIDGTVKYSPQDINYYLVDTSGANLSTLSYNTSTGKATGTFTNSTNVYAVVAPSYSLWDDFKGIRSWSLVMRPNGDSDFEVSEFANYEDALTGSTKTFFFSYAGDIDLSFDILNKTFKVTPYFTRTLSDQYATFSSDYDVAIPSGLKAYYASAKDGNNVTMTKYENGIASTDGAFLKGTAGSYTFTPATTTDVTGTNYLKPGTSAFTGGENYYVFAKQGSDYGFYKYNSSAIDMTGKAYLDLSGAGSRLNIVFADEASAISSVATEISASKVYHDLQGRRVAQPTKGMYIVNGKKMIIK